MKKMKKAILILSLWLGGQAIKAQTVNNLPIDSITAKYLTITTQFKGFTQSFYLLVSYDQSTQGLSMKNLLLIDLNGKPKEFNSIADALNYFNSFGYDYIGILPTAITIILKRTKL
jgi:hypothetical protein